MASPYSSSLPYSSVNFYNTGGALSATALYEIQQALSILSGQSAPPWREAQQAANIWAGTVGLDLLAALNVKNGTTGLGFNAVCNALAGTADLDAQDALSKLAGGGWD